MEKMPAQQPKHERELRLRDVSLERVRNTDLHEKLSETENETYDMLMEEKGLSIDNVFQFGDQENFLYVRTEAAQLDTTEDVIDVITSWGLEETDYIGYGTGANNVGFTKVASVIDRINQYGLGDDPQLALFLPIPYTIDPAN